MDGVSRLTSFGSRFVKAAIRRDLLAIGIALAGAGVSIALSANPTRARAGWRDLNHDGRLQPYENPALPVTRRVDDLLGRMTIEEKVGLMVHGSLPLVRDTDDSPARGYDMAAAERLIRVAHEANFNSQLTTSPAELARANNAVQRLAAATRLGIPVTLSTDPRNQFTAMPGGSVDAGSFTRWPDTLGFAALNDPDLVREFARSAAREYRAVGLNMALSPQADLFTEPRWARGNGTFGADPATVSRLAGAYVEGFQGSSAGLARTGVAAVVKHWVGYGAEPDGFDAHNYYGRFVHLDNASFARHVAAFDGPLRAHVAGVMPTYAVVTGVTVQGRPLEAVGAGYNKQLLTGLLRGKMGFKGLILSDFGITNDCSGSCREPSARAPQTVATRGMPWGVDKLIPTDRFAKGTDAGIDVFGGVTDPSILLAAVRARRISIARVNAAVRRVLTVKFELGLFDNPYVDPEAAPRIVCDLAVRARSEAAQRAALILLENRAGALPSNADGRRV